MKIEVGKDYRISSDRYNWMFQQRHISKKGEESWDTWGYWGTIESMLKCLPDHMARRMDGEDLSKTPEYLDTIKDLCDALSASREELLGILRR